MRTWSSGIKGADGAFVLRTVDRENTAMAANTDDDDDDVSKRNKENPIVRFPHETSLHGWSFAFM